MKLDRWGTMKAKLGTSVLSICAFLANPSFADLNVIVIDEGSLPYELSPSRYENSPSKYENSSSKYENSSSKYENSESRYENSSLKYDNGPSGNRRLITTENEFLGYYVFADSGVLNFFNTAGKRISYRPSNPDTKSVFTVDGDWCGSIGKNQGALVLGITENCLLQFLLKR